MRWWVICWIFFVPSGILAQETIELCELLVSAKLPPGYAASVNDLKSDGRIVGKIISINSPNQSARVTIQYESKELPDVAARRAAVKDYFHGYAASLVKLGYKTNDKTIPDFDSLTFEQPVSLSVYFFNDERPLWTHHEFFFTDHAFWVRATAKDQNALEELKQWAKTVRPKPKS